MILEQLTPYLIPIITGAVIGLIILFVAILPLMLWLRRRQQKPPLAPPPDETPTIPIVATEEKTIPSPPAADDDTPVSIKVVEVGEPVTHPVSGQRPERVGWQIAGLTDVGLKRELNEDQLLMTEADNVNAEPIGLYAVADGMGGHEKGEIASQLTLDTVQEHFTQRPPTPADAPFDEWLKTTAQAANEVVLARQGSDSQERKMGSTLVIALITGQQAHIANIGDSRAYLLRNNEIRQITEDHSLVERLVQIGQITREEARVHRQRNVIYNTIGDKADPQVSLFDITLAPNDRLLLCSDGLSNMINDEQILQISQVHASPVEACKELVKAAKSAGGMDNITAVVVQMNPS